MLDVIQGVFVLRKERRNETCGKMQVFEAGYATLNKHWLAWRVQGVDRSHGASSTAVPEPDIGKETGSSADGVLYCILKYVSDRHPLRSIVASFEPTNPPTRSSIVCRWRACGTAASMFRVQSVKTVLVV